jgi:hypothetical protein
VGKRDPAYVARGAKRSAVEFARRFLGVLSGRKRPLRRVRVTGSQLAYHGYLAYEGLDWDDLRKVADAIQRLAVQVGVFPRRFGIYLTARSSVDSAAKVASGKIATGRGKRVRYTATMHLTRDPRSFFVAAANWALSHAGSRLLSFRVHAVSDAPAQAKRTPRNVGPVKIGGKRPRGKTAAKTPARARR